MGIKIRYRCGVIIDFGSNLMINIQHCGNEDIAFDSAVIMICSNGHQTSLLKDQWIQSKCSKCGSYVYSQITSMEEIVSHVPESIEKEIESTAQIKTFEYLRDMEKDLDKRKEQLELWAYDLEKKEKELEEREIEIKKKENIQKRKTKEIVEQTKRTRKTL
jgi:hypothetical protein